MITNRDCFFNKKSDFINRLPDISPNSVVYIADTQQIWTQNKYFECAMTPDRVEELILAHGYLVADDIPNLTGGAVATNVDIWVSSRSQSGFVTLILSGTSKTVYIKVV